MFNEGISVKELGNQAFKSGDYTAAIGHYTSAILADPTNPTFPLNRAAAYLKLGKNLDAERDCSTTLKLESGNIKAWFRRGQARLALSKLAEARADFERALKLDPQNSAAKGELIRLEVAGDDSHNRNTSLVTGSISLPPRVYRRRVPIQIINTTQSLPTSFTPTNLSNPVPDSKVNQAVCSDFRDAKNTRQTLKSKVGGGIFRPSGQHTLFTNDRSNIDTKSTTTSLQTLPTVHHGPPKDQKGTKGPSNMILPQIPLDTAKTSSVPTLFDFSRHWSTLQEPQQRWSYLLNQVPPTRIPALFKQSLEAGILVSLLETFCYILETSSSTSIQATKPIVKDYIHYLTEVPRFKTVVLLMSAAEVDVVKRVWSLIDLESNDETQKGI